VRWAYASRVLFVMFGNEFKIKYSSFVKTPRQPEIRIRFGCGGQKKQGFVCYEYVLAGAGQFHET
jgi:hypothetical protein